MNNQGCRRERVHHVRQRLVKEAEPFTLDGRQRLAPDIWVTVSLLFLVSEMLKPDRIWAHPVGVVPSRWIFLGPSLTK
jgi:hypothetical protein